MTTVDRRTFEIQMRATDPAVSAWVSANAGTGKTYVLSRRVERLLLAGADPATILCLTFTKAAAAEMAKRIFDDLAAWTRHDDATLAAELARLEGAPPDARRLAIARRLFARALETPGGLKIQTIHAFCERLLHQFPFEAGVAGHFEVIEENVANEMVGEARRAVLVRAAGDPEGPLGRALAHVIGITSDQAHEDAIRAAVEARGAVLAWIDAAGGLAAALKELRNGLGLGDGDTVAALTAAIGAECLFSEVEIARLVRDLRDSGGKRDQEASARLAPFLRASSDAEKCDAWLGFLLTGAGALRQPSSVVSKAVRDNWPGLAERIEDELQRLETLLTRIAAARLYEASAALLTLAEAVIRDYERAKTARSYLDFDDLVAHTVRLLEATEAADWVRYKLDRGLDHILVDEAQDTSPSQWRVIQALATEFFAGKGASEAVRTVFAVGDEKQSIYSFQGAVPAWFARMEKAFGAGAAAAGRPFASLALHLSFRSTADILRAVDRIFDPADVHAGLASEAQPTVHEAARHGAAGRVVLWPMVEPPEKQEPEDWATPLDRPATADPALVLADRIGATVHGWLERGERLEATGERITAGDVLVLCRRRGLVSEAIIRSLKRRGVAVAGADRLMLSTHIAVLDLLALADAMLLPEDDLALAAVLKSPLVGLDEDTLYRLARGRDGSLWAALEQAAETDMFLRGACGRLAHWRGLADRIGPHGFFSRILGPDRGRRDFVRRLGPEVDDILDEFLARTLAYERSEAPSLTGFLDWMRDAAGEVKRDAEIQRDEVRVMTVHGAKGLEAPVVFLVDDGSAPTASAHDPRLLALADYPDAVDPAPLVWLATTRDAPPPVEARLKAQRRRAAEEYRRLFYVALTRARDRLYICGTRRGHTDAAMGWHGLAMTALADECRKLDETSDALEWRADWTLAPVAARASAAAGSPPPAMPDWIGRRLPVAAPVRRLTPSAGEADAPSSAPLRPGPAGEKARQRGLLAHSLLQALPELAAEHREARGRDFLGAAAPDWSEAEQNDLLAAILAILSDPGFAPLFGPGSRAEVAVAGRLAGAIPVVGRIDRLAVAGDRVLIVDFKTNRPFPTGLAEVPPAYLRQLALYRALLADLYPRHSVAAALLWTEGPSLMEIPADLLDRALPATAGRLDAGRGGS